MDKKLIKIAWVKFKYENITFSDTNIILTFFCWSIFTSSQHNMDFFMHFSCAASDSSQFFLNHRKTFFSFLNVGFNPFICGNYSFTLPDIYVKSVHFLNFSSLHGEKGVFFYVYLHRYKVLNIRKNQKKGSNYLGPFLFVLCIPTSILNKKELKKSQPF